MISQYLLFTGALILFSLGTVHLVYTFFSKKFSPRNGDVEEGMKSTCPGLTGETTVWKAWLGFNASHSSGAMFIGIVNCYMGVYHFTLFQSDPFFFIFNILTISFYAWLAKKYWFKIPLTGISITLICFILSCILTLVNK